MKNMKLITVASVLVFLAFAGLVSSSGIALPFFEENPLQVYPGQVGSFDITLQNGVGDADLVFDIEVSSPDLQVSIDRTSYNVEAGNVNVPVIVRYSVPENLQIGAKYFISISATTHEEDVEGGIRVGAANQRSVPVIIVETPAQSPGESVQESGNSSMIWYVVLAIVIVALIAWFVVKKKKK